MEDKDHPRVFFPSDSPGEHITFGYLFMIDGVPWVARTLEDARDHFPAISTPLDPQLLEGCSNGKQEPQPLQYRGLVPREHRPPRLHYLRRHG
jgi:hypothetical protein